jgi:NTE family protein
MVDFAPKVAIACQGGGTHAAFEVGVLTEVLNDIEARNRFELVGFSGTSAGALCALMVWYGLAPKKRRPESGSIAEAIKSINSFWDWFAASTPAEIMQNAFSHLALTAQEQEVPVLGINAPVFGLNPRGVLSHAFLAELQRLGVRKEYIDFDAMLTKACPEFDDIDWPNVPARLLLGASEIVNGVETVFDSDCNIPGDGGKHTEASVAHRWRQRLPLSLRGVAASGTLPAVREAEKIDDGYYWDGLYSQNPPIREFLAGVRKEHVPDEIWVLRINPQQTAELPRSNVEIRDRENELMGNLSLNKELDFILVINDMIVRFGGRLAEEYKPVTVRTIKMKEETAARLQTSSKFDRSRNFIDKLRSEGSEVARDWLNQWPNVGDYPEDAAYRY